MATRRLRIALCQHHRHLKHQALAQESAAGHLVHLANTLQMAGGPEAARCPVKIARCYEVKAICLNVQANASSSRAGLLL
jgi:hypothetical protein